MFFCKWFFRPNGLVFTPKTEPVYTVAHSRVLGRNASNLKIKNDVSHVSSTAYPLGAGIARKRNRGLTHMNQNFPFDSPAKPEAAMKLFTVPLQETNVVLVDGRTLIEAESLISGCEHCNRDAEISFDYVLDELTGCDPTRTEYLMYRTGRCPNCRSEVTEKTLIIPE